MVVESKIKKNQKIDNEVSFWDELKYVDPNSLKYLPYGSIGVEIPIFYRDCIQKNIQKMKIQDFQYTFEYGDSESHKSIIDNFSEIAHVKNLNYKTNVAMYLGATHLISSIQMMLLKEDIHEGVLFEPYYPNHFKGLKQKGKPIVSINLFNEKSGFFEYDFKDFESKLNENTKFVVFCNPNNPTCRVMTENEYQKFTEILNNFPHIRIIEDCAYSVYLNKDIKIKYFHEFGNNFDKTYTIFSLGKIFNTTGNRLGFCISSEKLIAELKYFLSGRNTCGATDQKFYQIALKEALKPYGECINYWEYTKKDIQHRIDYLTEKLTDLKIKVYPNEGSYYLTIDSIYLSTFVEQKYFLTLGPNSNYQCYRDRAVSRKLISEYQICLVPFSGVSYQIISPFDCFLRIVVSRSYDELDLLINAFQNIVHRK